MNEFEKDMENLAKELESQELACPYCSTCFDSRSELELHMENCEYKKALEEKAEKLSDIEEPKKAMEIIKENIKREILASATKRQLKEFEQSPEALENLIRERMLGLALKHPMIDESSEMMLMNLRESQKVELENRLKIGYCGACGQTLGSSQALFKHLEEQSKVSEEHRRYKKYLDMIGTPSDKLPEAFKEEEEKESEAKYGYGYQKYGLIECPVCGQFFNTWEEFKVHWSKAHQLKYGELQPFGYGVYKHPEKLSKEQEDRQRQENLMILKALLRNKLE